MLSVLILSSFHPVLCASRTSIVVRVVTIIESVVSECFRKIL